MAALSAAQIAAIARQAGFPESAIPTAVAVALAESSGIPNQHNQNSLTGDDSYGLWQINMLGSMGPARRKQFGISTNDQLYDPVTNARAALVLSNGGKNWGPWSTYPVKSALYMPTAQKAVGASKGMVVQANWFSDWWDDVKGGWEKGYKQGSDLGDGINGLVGTPSPEDLANGNLTSPGDSGIWSIGTLLTGFAKAITNPDNWRDWAYVGLGGALVIAGLVIVTKPYAQQVANMTPTGALVGKLKGKG
ncbi:Transglycosylase SLT domain-containing protein [Streptomyces sp. 3213]|uniref:transglycosylase SLT domain-containing protein n=1 Tax=Streptomyces sp. 3213.3 TaxID=1855348 RepID=UPI00089C5F7B|nr:transglycosylase SLT domain-containing protein [Streptomyces sp. 3213.3]SEF12881.1 Transglycosylase SLT domain-containing protein [Streptomyces sp. 3213] [Streptomyces sp. 3213.3]